MSTAISSFQAWAGSLTSRSESLTASFTTRTSKQYDSRRHNPSVRADQLGSGSARHEWCFISTALLAQRLPVGHHLLQEVLSSVTRASSASFFGRPFPLSSLGGSLEPCRLFGFMAVVGGCKVVANRVRTTMVPEWQPLRL